jgi:hypothetical protein
MVSLPLEQLKNTPSIEGCHNTLAQPREACQAFLRFKKHKNEKQVRFTTFSTDFHAQAAI